MSLAGAHACGCVMDMLRSCYKSRQAIYRDRPDVLVDGEWHWCEPGADAIPFHHIYGASVWDSDEAEFYEGLGEQKGSLGYSKGRNNHRYLGKHFCGAATLWEDGQLYSKRGTMPVDHEGVPYCCDQTGGLKSGNGATSGHAAVWHETPFYAEGGILFGGEGTFATSWSATGGMEFGGEGTFGTAWTATGGLKYGGVGIFAMSWPATGGIAFGGKGVFGTSWPADGGIEFGGEGDFGTMWPATGGVEFGGEGDFGSMWAATGGMKFGGQGIFSSSWPATGGMKFGGEGVFGTAWPATGGIKFGGEGDFSTTDGDPLVTGMVVMWPSTAAVPAGWLECDGSDKSSATYPDLSTLLGTTWGSPGGGNFRLPKFNTRIPVGVGALSGNTTRTLADVGGTETHTLTSAEMPAHTHPQQANTVVGGAVIGLQASLMTQIYASGGTTQSTGGGGSHNNMPPFIAVRFIIKT